MLELVYQLYSLVPSLQVFLDTKTTTKSCVNSSQTLPLFGGGVDLDSYRRLPTLMSPKLMKIRELFTDVNAMTKRHTNNERQSHSKFITCTISIEVVTIVYSKVSSFGTVTKFTSCHQRMVEELAILTVPSRTCNLYR